jgi:hypothetical protein
VACGGNNDLGRCRLIGVGAGKQDRAAGLVKELDNDLCALLRGLSRSVHGLGQSLAQRAMVVDPGEAEIGEREAPEAPDCIVGRAGARSHVVEELSKRGLVHQAHYPASV